MIKNVLIVDDDQEMLLSVKEGLEKYDETFSVLMAGDGLLAIDKLKGNPVSLVVTDLKMPRMNGFALLAHIIQHYPDIPVIIITAYSTPEMEKQARKGGAVGYIEKPFMIEDLAKKIITTLRKESEGGTLHGISSGMFLQLIEMEQKTCTIRVTDRSSEKKGVLFFQEGDLLDARSNGKQGEAAAYEIFSWDEVNLSIQNVCPLKGKKIKGDLQAILLEAMRLKDESTDVVEEEIEEITEFEEVPVTEAESSPVASRKATDPIQAIWNRLEAAVGDRCGLEDIYKDSSWNGLITRLQELGVFFGAGNIQSAYIDRGESSDYILLPADKVTVISVNPTCPKERIIQALGE